MGDNADIFFQDDHLRSELKRRTVRGGAVTMASQGVKFILNLASTVLLYRWLKLSPDDRGLVGDVITLTGLVALFKDLGLSRATIQKDKITREQTSTLFWVNVTIGVIAMLLTWALAPGVAKFYGDPRLLQITIVMGSAFAISGTAVQHQALLQRQMQFSTLAVIDAASMVFGIALAVVLGLFHMGYWSIVFMQVGTTIANNIGTWIACPWRPGRPQKGTGVKSMLKFGGNLAGFNIVNYFQRTLDNVLVGRYGSTRALGFYSQAYSLLMLPVQQISTPMSNVAVPALSRLQKDPKQFRSYYRKAIEMITTVSMPVVVLLSVVANDVIFALLGKQWLAAAPIFRWLGPAAFVGTFNVATGWVYVSLGRTDRQMRMVSIVTPLTVLGFVVGGWLGNKYWGDSEAAKMIPGYGYAMGVAISFSISNLVLRYPTIVYCFKGTPLKAADMLAALWRPATASLAAGAAVAAVNLATPFGHLPPIGRLVSNGILYGILYIAMWLILPGGRQFLMGAKSLLKEMTGKKPAKPVVTAVGGSFDAKPSTEPSSALPRTAGVATTL